MHRAAHQLLDNPPVFADPLALTIIGAEAATQLRDGSDWHGRPSNGLRAFIAARSRLAEDTLLEAMAEGTRQYVLLGAGLDTFAYRAGFPALKVFEIDHPATQGWKRERLAQEGIALPTNVVYVPVNFETDMLFDALSRAGFAWAEQAVFAWLGVTPYLEHETVLETLRAVARKAATGSAIVFDYAEQGIEDAGFTAMAERVAALGEPFRGFFQPASLGSALEAMGYTKVEDFDSDAINARYFANRADELKLRGRGHLMRAYI
jgi:methyltransferase (TIGR00027 family)